VFPKLCWLTGMTLMVIGSPAFGDGPPGKTADRPTAVHKELDRLVGTWDVALEFRYGDKAMKGTATCQAKWLPGGRFVQQEYTSVFMGKPLTIIQLIGYDDMKKKLIEIHLASNRNQVTMNEGDVTDDGKTWTNVGELMNVATKKAAKLRTVYKFKDADSFTLEWFQPDPASEGKEVRVVSMTHTRKK
jgi:hypothetical protein